jgi:hypothetical protein
MVLSLEASLGETPSFPSAQRPANFRKRFTSRFPTIFAFHVLHQDEPWLFPFHQAETRKIRVSLLYGVHHPQEEVEAQGAGEGQALPFQESAQEAPLLPVGLEEFPQGLFHGLPGVRFPSGGVLHQGGLAHLLRG